MKIRYVTDDHILFDNGNTITFDHDQDCCENNYADFMQLDDEARAYDYDEKNMRFEAVEGSGFRFGDNRRMFFVPCYSDQDGYYSDKIEIHYKTKVLDFSAELREY